MSNEEHENIHSENRGQKKSEPDIMYVPLDVRTIENKDDSIDVLKILRTLWNGKKTVYRTIAVFTVIGLLIAFISVEEYTSNVRVLPESETGLSLGALGGIAQQFGFSAAPNTSTEMISVNAYPAIINSNIFLNELMQYEVALPNSSERVSLKQYVNEYQSGSIVRFIIRFPFIVKKWIYGIGGENITEMNLTEGDSEKLNRLLTMSQEDWETLRQIRERIFMSTDSETGVITISVKLQDAVIAATVADEVVQKLSEYVIEKRTEKARRELIFIENRFEEAKSNFESIQKELAEFNDQNRGQLTALARTEEQMLQSRYNLNFNLYNSMAERLEQARIKLQEETPVINIIEPAAIPDQRSEPNRILILISFFTIGGIAGVGAVFAKPIIEKFRHEFSIK